MRRVRTSAGSPNDQGFTLIEVVAALGIMVIVSTAALYFFVGGTRAVTQQQRTQDAVTVANEAMESAYAVAAKSSGTVSGVLAGRTQAAATAAWTTGTSKNVDGINQSYLVWDTAAAPGATPAVPISVTSKHSKVAYKATTIIGTCYRSNSGGANAPCGKLAAYTDDPGTAPSGYAKIMRVMVLVTWPSSASTCAGGTCSFQSSSLIDPNNDQLWNNTTNPIAVDDAAVVYVGNVVNIDVVRNDFIGPVSANPIINVTVTGGTGTAALQSNGTVNFTAPSNASGKMTFTYQLKDAAGRQSNAATVTVSVLPRAVNDTVSMTTGTTAVPIAVTANDKGSPASVAISTPVAPTTATATASGLNISFNPNGKVGTFTLQYTYTDTSGFVTDAPATLTVNVTPYATPLVTDFVLAFPATSTAVTTPIDMATQTGNPANYLYEVKSAPSSPGKLKVGNTSPATNDFSGSNTTGKFLGYNQPAGAVALFSFVYDVKTPDSSVTSGTKTGQLVVVPVPANDNFTFNRGTTNNALTLAANDLPTGYGGNGVQFIPVATSSPNCGTLTAASSSDLNNGTLRFTAGGTAKTCSFTYVAQTTVGTTTVTSTPATVSITVK